MSDIERSKWRPCRGLVITRRATVAGMKFWVGRACDTTTTTTPRPWGLWIKRPCGEVRLLGEFKTQDMAVLHLSNRLSDRTAPQGDYE